MDSKSNRSINVAVVGFPYIRENAFAVFLHWPEPQRICFLLPKSWPIKGGKVVYRPPSDLRITTARAFFSGYHWSYPIIGGLLKGWMPTFPLFLWRNRRHIGVVYACSEPVLMTTIYYAFWTRLFGKKLALFTWENFSYTEKFRNISRFVHGVLLRINLALAHGLMCGNRESADIHRRLTRHPIRIIPMNGLETEKFRLDTRAGEHRTNLSSKVVYAFAGAIGERKGIHILLKAYSEVLRLIPDTHLVIAGSGEYEDRISALIDELSIGEHVTRLQWINHHELVRLLSVTDVFVYPSLPYKGWSEQFGYSMAESSLMELPVISTRSGSIPDLVKDGQTGILVPPGDTQALADAMIKLGINGDLRRRLGQAGRAYISATYSNDIVARKMYDFLQSL